MSPKYTGKNNTSRSAHDTPYDGRSRTRRRIHTMLGQDRPCARRYMRRCFSRPQTRTRPLFFRTPPPHPTALGLFPPQTGKSTSSPLHFLFPNLFSQRTSTESNFLWPDRGPSSQIGESMAAAAAAWGAPMCAVPPMDVGRVLLRVAV